MRSSASFGYSETLNMSEMKPGQSGTVAGLHVNGMLYRRLLDLGLVEGASVKAMFASPAGDPMVYRIRGAQIALRRADAALVEVVTGVIPLKQAMRPAAGCSASGCRSCSSSSDTQGRVSQNDGRPLVVALAGNPNTGLVVSYFLSRTILKGVASSFTLEMPPYRPPQIGRVLYTSFIDRTLLVLWRAVICAAPAGGLIWLLGAIPVGDSSLYVWLRDVLNPFGKAIGLDGVILIAYIFAIPANEIVVPTILMGYLNSSKMLEIDNPAQLFIDNGWTLTTAICLMLFSLLHYPCTTTTLTIYRETQSKKWAFLANAIPLAIAIVVCFIVAQMSRILS